MCIDAKPLLMANTPMFERTMLDYKQSFKAALKKEGYQPVYADMAALMASEWFNEVQIQIGSITDQELMSGMWQRLNNLENSAYRLAGAKMMSVVNEIKQKVAKDAGDMSFIDTFYNTAFLNWSSAEKSFMVRAANAGVVWQEIQDQKDIFPYLKHHAILDDRVRPKHKLLNDLTLPVDHPFWKRYPIPLDWNCRCYRTQETEPGIISEEPKNLKLNVHNFFKNPKMYDGMVMNRMHPYQRSLTKIKTDTYMNPVIEKAPHREYQFNDYRIAVSAFTRLGDIQEGTFYHRYFYNQGKRVELPSVFESQKNPDALIDGIRYDWKKVSSDAEISTIENLLASGIQQVQPGGVVVLEITALSEKISAPSSMKNKLIGLIYENLNKTNVILRNADRLTQTITSEDTKESIALKLNEVIQKG